MLLLRHRFTKFIYEKVNRLLYNERRQYSPWLLSNTRKTQSMFTNFDMHASQIMITDNKWDNTSIRDPTTCIYSK